MAGKSFFLFLALIIISTFASAHRPLVVKKHEIFEPSRVVEKDGGRDLNVKVKIDGDQKNVNDIGNGNRVGTDAIKNDAISIGLPPVPLPGGYGRFHFDLGPIGFGGNWQWGSVLPLTGFVVQYSPPYIVVSPYSQPYVTPYPRPEIGYGQPQHGYLSPYPLPLPLPGGFVYGSFRKPGEL